MTWMKLEIHKINYVFQYVQIYLNNSFLIKIKTYVSHKEIAQILNILTLRIIYVNKNVKVPTSHLQTQSLKVVYSNVKWIGMVTNQAEQVFVFKDVKFLSGQIVLLYYAKQNVLMELMDLITQM